MSIALARKYRPQTFADLIGQEAIAKTLQQAIASGRIHHAYIFTGTRGVGKTTTARIFAKALNCQKGPATEPCNTCSNCLEITASNSVDVLEIDAASHTKVEETRELLGRVVYSPAAGKYRIFIIDEAHMLSKSSFNALLKTLEEPPAHAVFILATTEPQKILDTVRSRCLEFVFRRITPGNIALNLRQVLSKENIQFDEEAVLRLAIEADGSMRDALSLTDQVLGFAGGVLQQSSVELALGLTSKDVVANLWIAIFARDAMRVHHLLSQAYYNGADLRRLGIDLAEFLRQTIVCRTCEQPGEGLQSGVVEASLAWSLTDLYRMFDRLHATLLNVERSPVPDLVMETGLLRLAVLEPLGRLEDLLSAAGGGSPPAPPSGNRGEPTAPRPTGVLGRAVPETQTITTTAMPAMPLSTASDAANVVSALAETFASIGPYIKKYGQWDGRTLLLEVPESEAVVRQILEFDTPDLIKTLKSLGYPHALVCVRAVANEHGPNQQQQVAKQIPASGDKRALLEDERLRALLKAFPGAEIVDVRRLQ